MWTPVAALLLGTLLSASAPDGVLRGVVVDQTGLPLPGAVVELRAGDEVLATTTTGADGTFEIGNATRGDIVFVALDGFESVTVPRERVGRIELPLAHATVTTTVVATADRTLEGTTVATLGSSLNADTVARMPSTHMKARESLPLLPSVVRGPDGLMQVGGARPSDTPLLVDGFNVTNPATGISSLNVPFEAVQSVDMLRDPMTITYGNLMGGLVQIRSTPGGNRFTFGVQGFVPRPRLTSPGFGRIEGIFPRVYAGGGAAGGRIHYFAAAEYDYERIPVPEVTGHTGPDIVETSATLFGRLDLQTAPRNSFTVQGFIFPNGTRSKGLSPRRAQSATVNFTGGDSFVGFTDRLVVNSTSVLTLQFAALGYDTTSLPNGKGASYLTPMGWTGNWFAYVTRRSAQYAARASWERAVRIGSTIHELTAAGEVAARRLSGLVHEGSIAVLDGENRIVRRAEFGAARTMHAADVPLSIAVRDEWRASSRLTVDAGARMDSSSTAPAVPSARAGVRFALDHSGETVVKGGYGMFVANLPLAALAYESYPTRVESDLDPETGDTISALTYEPVAGPFTLPRAVTVTGSVERQLSRNLDVQVTFTNRQTTNIATLRIPANGGVLPVRSDGSSAYHDIEISGRRRWPDGQQLFVGYVRASGKGEFNDFSTLFQSLAVPLLQRAGITRLPTDARHRIILWGTMNLPNRVVVSPVVEWRSGFPYTIVDQRYAAVEPNVRSYPPFMALDVVAYKTFTVKRRSADLGVQLFNATNHFNPRDVYPVLGTPQWGRFTNSVGPIIRGFMMLKWADRK